VHPILSALIQGLNLSGSIPQDAAAFLSYHNCPKTAAHCQQVADTAVLLAQRFGIDQLCAAQAGWLHDISAVFPNAERLAAAQQLGLEILPEEAAVPLLLHQKISASMANQIFHIEDAEVLSAVGCHTTLKTSPGALDLLLFVADKLSWDQEGTPPYAEEIQAALNHSLEEAAWVYQDHVWHSGKLKIIHPWMLASYKELGQKFG
jgi:predicted HD superfamily hydrolase involved in NAD metabolism